MRIPEDVEKIIAILNDGGFEAYAVGGCVRDTLLHKAPEDWDITTSAKPEQVKALFKRTIDTGIQHGTVTVMMNRVGYEVTTYRIDGEYEDGRHPNHVEYTTSLLEDLKRRDFTINAMAYSHESGIVDAFGGVEDLDRHVIRCVGNPHDRFTEDALRILRALRFSAQLGFQIEEETGKAVRELAPNLVHVSRERIQVELTKLLLSAHPDRVKLVFDMGLVPWIFDPIPPMSRERIQIPVSLPGKKHVRWAAFLEQLTPENAEELLRGLKLDNDTIARTKTLVAWRFREIPEDKPGIRRVMSQMSRELYEDLLELQKASAPDEALASLCRVEDKSREIREAGDPLSLKELAVDGGDLIKAGVKPGKEMGKLLNSFLDQVLEDPERNRREYLLAQI